MDKIKIKNALFAGHTSTVVLILLIPLVFLIPFTLTLADYTNFIDNKLISSLILLAFLLLVIISLLFVIHKILLKPTKEEKEIINKNIQTEWRSITKDEIELIKSKLLPKYNIHPFRDIISILILSFIFPLLTPRVRRHHLPYELSIILGMIIATIIIVVHYISSYITILRKKWQYSNFESNYLLTKAIDITIIKTYTTYSGPHNKTYNKFGVFILDNKKYVIKIPAEINKNDKIKIIIFCNNTIILF